MFLFSVIEPHSLKIDRTQADICEPAVSSLCWFF